MEVSAGVYKAQAKDAAGRTVTATGLSADDAIAKCRRMASDMDDPRGM